MVQQNALEYRWSAVDNATYNSDRVLYDGRLYFTTLHQYSRPIQTTACCPPVPRPVAGDSLQQARRIDPNGNAKHKARWRGSFINTVASLKGNSSIDKRPSHNY